MLSPTNKPTTPKAFNIKIDENYVDKIVPQKQAEVGKTYQLAIAYLSSTSDLTGMDWAYHVIGKEKWIPIGIADKNKGIFEYVKLSDLLKFNIDEKAILKASEVKNLNPSQTKLSERKTRAESVRQLIEGSGLVRSEEVIGGATASVTYEPMTNLLKREGGQLLASEPFDLNAVDDFLIKCDDAGQNGKQILASELNKIPVKDEIKRDEIEDKKQLLALHFITKAININDKIELKNTAKFLEALYPKMYIPEHPDQAITGNLLLISLESIAETNGNLPSFIEEITNAGKSKDVQTTLLKLGVINEKSNLLAQLNSATVNREIVKSMIKELEKVEAVSALKEVITTNPLSKIESVIEFAKLEGAKEIFEEVIADLKEEGFDSKMTQVVERIFLKLVSVKNMQSEAINDTQLLNDYELFKICAVAEITLENTKQTSGAIHISKTKEDLAHSVVIDLKTRSFTILLKDSAKINSAGGFGKAKSVIVVSNAILGKTAPSARHYVQKVGKARTPLTNEEVYWTKKYQPGTHELTYINSKGANKKTIITEGFDGSLTLGLHNHTFTDAQIISILTQIATQLEIMHENDDVHCDLKLDNILYREENNGQFNVRIADYGLVNSDRLKLYGTPLFSSPGILLNFINNQLYGEEFLVGPRDDMYALGIEIFKMVTGDRPKWTKRIHGPQYDLKTVNTTIDEQEKIGKVIENAKNKETNRVKKQLLDIAGRLMEPNDDKRLTAKKLKASLEQIKTT